MHWGWTQYCSGAPSLPGWVSLGFCPIGMCNSVLPFFPSKALVFLFTSSDFLLWNVGGVRAEMCFSSIGNCSCLALPALPAFPALLSTFDTGISGVPHHPKDLFIVFVYLHNKISEDFRAFSVGSCPSVQSDWYIWKYLWNNHSLDSYCIPRALWKQTDDEFPYFTFFEDKAAAI